MPEKTSEAVLTKEASEPYDLLLASDQFANATRCRQFLKVLWRQWQTNPAKRVRLGALIKKFGLAQNESVSAGSLVRNTADTTRHKLLQYYDANPAVSIGFAVPKAERKKGGFGYQLQVTRRKVRADYVQLISGHRGDTEGFRRLLCDSGPDVLFVTTAAQHNLGRVRSWFKNRNAFRGKHLRILTWRPEEAAAAGAIAAFAAHLDDDADALAEHMAQAWTEWKRLEKDYEFVEVYSYSSTPTMHGICTEALLHIELFPFNRGKEPFHECGTHNNRPALLIRAGDRSYAMMRNAFEDLWLDALWKAQPEDVHPRWRESRIQRLEPLVGTTNVSDVRVASK